MSRGSPSCFIALRQSEHQRHASLRMPAKAAVKPHDQHAGQRKKGHQQPEIFPPQLCTQLQAAGKHEIQCAGNDADSQTDERPQRDHSLFHAETPALFRSFSHSP